MTHASVFSGIGGPEVAAAMLGWENLFHCEINPFGRAVLNYWFPNSKSYEDITTTDFSEWGGKVNVLTGGFPCQPFSYAGQRRGADDDRYLWPFMHRCINQVRPDWVVCENVGGILTMVEQGDITQVAAEKSLFDEGDTLYRYRLEATFTLERICQDLERDGYAVQAVIIPACAVNAPHRRDRVFIIGCRNDIADTDCDGLCARRSSGRIWAKMDERRVDEPLNGVERLGTPQTATHPAFSGEAAHRKGDGTESGWSDSNQLTGERRAETQRDSGLSSVLRPAADTSDTGLQEARPEQQAAGDRGFGLRNGSDAPNPDCNRRCEMDEHLQPRLTDGAKPVGNGRERDAADTSSERPQTGHRGRETGETSRDASGWYARSNCDIAGCGRWDTFPTVSPVHRGNDGLPFPLDDLTIPASKWRTESLKAYGNAIVPQVMYEIFRAIEETYK